MSGPGFIWSVLYAVGLLFTFIGERILATGQGRVVFTALGCALVLVARIRSPMKVKSRPTA